MTRKYDQDELTIVVADATRIFEAVGPEDRKFRLMGKYIAHRLDLDLKPAPPEPGTWWINEGTGSLYFRIKDQEDGQDAWSFREGGTEPVKAYFTPWERFVQVRFPSASSPICPF